MFSKYKDIILGVVLLIITGIYYSGTFMELKFAMSDYGAAFVPRIYTGMAAIISILMIITGIWKIKTNQIDSKITRLNKKNTKKVITVISILIGYVLLLPRLGFLTDTVLVLIVLINVLASEKTLKLKNVMLYSVIAGITINWLFVKVFYLRLPVGIIGF